MNPCYYHPGTSASATCVKCGMPICQDCTESVGAKTSCPRCVDFVRQHASAATNAAAMQAVRPVGAGTYKTGTDPSYYTQLAAGLGLGLVIGTVLSILVMKILFYVGFGLSLLYIAVGFGVGFGIHKVTGRGGAGLATAGVVVMLISLLIAHLSYANDVLGSMAAKGEISGASVFDVFVPVMASLSIMHWICILIGLGACFRAIAAQGD